MVEVSVIIPVYKDRQKLIKCLEALERQTLQKESYEVIIVNNDSDNKLIINDIFEFNYMILDETKPGSYAARNTGLLNANGKLLAFTDSDCIPDNKWLQTGLNYFNNDAISRLAGNVEIYLSEKTSIGEYHDVIFAFNQEKNAKNGHSVTANFFVKKELFKSIGLFNEYMYSGGDLEWNERATNLNYNIIYASDCIVYHPARGLRENLQKVKRVYTKGFSEKRKNLNRIELFLNGLKLLRPPLIEITEVMRTEIVKKNGLKFGVIFVCVLRRYVRFLEHFRLYFGGKNLRS